MSKVLLPFSVADISAFASALRRQLDGYDHPPSHVEMLNLLAKAGGYTNFQHFRAVQAPQEVQPEQPPAPINEKLVKQVARFFDGDGRLIRWPKKFSQRMVCLWVLWSRIPAQVTFTETQMNEWLGERHLFGDYALLRRELVDRGLATRTADGRQYKRLEVQPPAEALLLFKHLRA